MRARPTLTYPAGARLPSLCHCAGAQTGQLCLFRIRPLLSRLDPGSGPHDHERKPDRKTTEVGTGVFGHFSFSPVATETFGFLVSVDRVELDNAVAMVAQPPRSLMDLVASRKTEWQGLDWIENGLRIDIGNLAALKKSDFSSLRPVHKHKRARRFLNEFETAVLSSKSVHPRRKELRD
jgi:hypothetical protein